MSVIVPEDFHYWFHLHHNCSLIIRTGLVEESVIGFQQRLLPSRFEPQSGDRAKACQ
jgi:hypothetical protein